MTWSSSDVSAGDEVTSAQYNNLRADTQDVFEQAVPIGTVVMWAGAEGSLPSNWLVCDGSAVNRTTYSDLYSALGNTFGAGNGSTTFNIPDLQDKFVVGSGDSYSRGASGGSNTVNSSHTHTVNSHSHSIAQHSHTVNSHRHKVNDHYHGSGTLMAEIYRSAQYDMHMDQRTGASWTSDTFVNLYNSRSNTHSTTGGTDVQGTTDDASPYTNYQSPGTNTSGATSTGNSSPSTGSGGSSSLENRPPYVGLFYIIKVS